jgi:prevent-host-death family protein
VKTVNVHEAKTHLSRLFERAHAGEEIVIAKSGEPYAPLVPLPGGADLIPDDLRGKIKKWSDYIDYWAIDWNFQNDTFMNGWVAYRTRKERKLPFSSDPHDYEKPGRYSIMVKVVGMFGNDTSQVFETEIR